LALSATGLMLLGGELKEPISSISISSSTSIDKRQCSACHNADIS
jgi:hypothetical protein